MPDLGQPLGAPLDAPVQGPTFVDRVDKFLSANPVLGSILTATPWGSRVVGALGQLALLQQRRAAEQRQQELDTQLGQIGEIENEPDAQTGLDRLQTLDRSKLRPDAFKGLVQARTNLTTRAAANAAARARVQEAPATTQDFPMSPDRSERAGFVPPSYYTDQQVSERAQGNPDEFQPNGGRPYPAAGPGDRSGEMRTGASRFNPNSTIIDPAKFRMPETEQELRDSLNDRDRALYLQATSFRGAPADVGVVEAAARARAAALGVNKPEDLDQMLTALEGQYAALGPEEQKKYGPLFQNARAQVNIAKNNPRGPVFTKALGAVERVQSVLDRHSQFAQTMDIRRAGLQEKQYQFDTNLARVDASIKQQDTRLANDLINQLQAEVDKMPNEIMELQLMGPQMAPVVASMREAYLSRLRELHFRRERLSQEVDAPRPNPPTGAGPATQRSPNDRPVIMPPRSRTREGPGTPRVEGRAAPKTKTLKNGVTVTVEQEP